MGAVITILTPPTLDDLDAWGPLDALSKSLDDQMWLGASRYTMDVTEGARSAGECAAHVSAPARVFGSTSAGGDALFVLSEPAGATGAGSSGEFAAFCLAPADFAHGGAVSGDFAYSWVLQRPALASSSAGAGEKAQGALVIGGMVFTADAQSGGAVQSHVSPSSWGISGALAAERVYATKILSPAFVSDEAASDGGLFPYVFICGAADEHIATSELTQGLLRGHDWVQVDL